MELIKDSERADDKRSDDAPAAPPDIRELFPGPIDIRSLALTGIFILAVFYTLYFAQDFLLPIVLAVLLSFVFSPLVGALRKLRIPESIGAAIVMITALLIIGYGILSLTTPAADWLKKLPETAKSVETKIKRLQRPVQDVTRAAEKVEKMTGSSQSRTVQLQENTLSERVFARARSFGAGLFVLIFLLYFLLASGDLFLRKLVKVIPNFSDKKIAVEIARTIQRHISQYLLTVTLINIVTGVVIGVGLALLNLPNAFLWGVVAGLLNFIPYLGAATGIAITAAVSFLTFDNVGYALIAPGFYLIVNIIEGNILTPIILGRRLTLNPVVVFLCLIFWGWLWGMTGAFLAVPMVATFKIFCDHIQPLAAIGEFLGD